MLAFHAHPDTWFLVVCSAAAYWYALTRLGPKVLPRGTSVVGRAQVVSFAGGLALLWVASDWPLHDLAERYLYSAHMLQHMLVSLLAPPLLLMGVPAWLTRWILRPRALSSAVRVVCRPLVATVIFNSVIAIGHAPFYVNGTLEHHFLHFWAHLLLFSASMIMWFPVVNKLPEYPTMSPPLKMGYLFIQSIVPNVPVAFLAIATGVVYKFYATVPHPWINAVTDQQLAAAIMKVGGTFYLWSIILVIFFRWAGSGDRKREAAEERAASAAAGAARIGRAAPVAAGPEVAMPDVLTWDHVAGELARSQPARPGP
jgi:putative membrane protein